MSAVEVVRSYLGAFDGADPDAIAAHVSEDFWNEHVSALGSSSRGRQQYLARLPAFLGDFADLHYEIEEIVAQGERVYVAYEMSARYQGRSPIRLRGVFRFEVVDGLILHRVDYFDSKSFLDQVEGG